MIPSERTWLHLTISDSPLLVITLCTMYKSKEDSQKQGLNKSHRQIKLKRKPTYFRCNTTIIQRMWKHVSCVVCLHFISRGVQFISYYSVLYLHFPTPRLHMGRGSGQFLWISLVRLWVGSPLKWKHTCLPHMNVCLCSVLTSDNMGRERPINVVSTVSRVWSGIHILWTFPKRCDSLSPLCFMQPWDRR